MKKADIIKNVSERSNRINYEGKYSDLQTFGSSYQGKRYQSYEQDPYSLQQNFLYKRAMFGLTTYSQKEIKSMHVAKRARIEKVHKRTQKELNLWKQEKVIELTNKMFGMFHHSPMAQEIIDTCSEVDEQIKNSFNFSDLGIKKKDIVNRLINVGILPRQFFTL